ncbi:DUF3859 domain-containing protein [Colwellia sp. E2M01]|uniref:DUF3859 domain-containing protein n=1 Tax=Colwellia sp. E2M01 TaxID=2841561 RepID=UPI001C0844D2|nr:DUF3859 domain-containing protein [Colwellia sp. E2M01]MBU2871708.1 DUF3859 domain-containing protein [Colwellia sp. E2M01]
MAKTKPEFSMKSYGIYSEWDANSKDLPKIKKFTTEIPAEIDIEFGYIINVKKGKGCKLNFILHHPDVLDEKGQVMAPFEGEVYVKTNDWDFFLGDTIWEPIDDKVGPWRIVIEYQGRNIADKTFNISVEESYRVDDFAALNQKFNKRR